MAMTSDAYRQAGVYVQNKFAGIIRETDGGYEFCYDAEYASSSSAAVSLTLPLTEVPYESGTLFAFFDGLIPEGWLLDVASRNWTLDRKDRFGLLMVCCRDCIGDVSIREVPHEVQG